MNYHGIDVSEFQGRINWQEVKADGEQFAMVRAGYGDNNIDGEFENNAAECSEAGIPFGVYWFSYALNEAEARMEARYCVDAIQGYKVAYPVCIDFEQASIDYAQEQGVDTGSDWASGIVAAFCDEVESLGYFAMFYTDLSLLETMLNPGLREKYALWLADYDAEPGTSGMAMWQYRDDGLAAGIAGNVDMDIAYYDMAQVISKNGLNKLKETVGTSPSSRTTPKDVLTYVVKRGDTLSGIAGKYGTTYQELAAYNNIANPNLIYPGEVILIPLGFSAQSQYYTIEYGDTLSGIAERFGTTVAELQRLNGIEDPNVIYAGDTIRV